jgi:hypothetical protein
MLRKIPPFIYRVYQELTSTSNDYAKLLASRVHEEKAKRDELRKRRASSMRK